MALRFSVWMLSLVCLAVATMIHLATVISLEWAFVTALAVAGINIYSAGEFWTRIKRKR